MKPGTKWSITVECKASDEQRDTLTLTDANGARYNIVIDRTPGFRNYLYSISPANGFAEDIAPSPAAEELLDSIARRNWYSKTGGIDLDAEEQPKLEARDAWKGGAFGYALSHQDADKPQAQRPQPRR